MLEYTGKYASCKVFVDTIEESALTQIFDFLNCPAAEGMTLRFMPDIHAGAGCVIGFTGTLTDKIIPNLIGVDIGCGVSTVRIHEMVAGEPEFTCDLPALDQFIRENIPSGCRVRDRPLPYKDMWNVEAVAIETSQDPDYVHKSMCSLGGGNHFIELGRDQFGGVWATVHTGSRNFGLKIANFHQKKAVPTVGKGKGLEWLEGDAAALYRGHMQVAQHFAAENRRAIMMTLMNFFKMHGSLDECLAVNSVHNYINFDDKIIRKGAISAHEGERVVIPWNMRDGMIVGIGKGNADWNRSAPHGAGRVHGRREAKRLFTVEQFKDSMVGVWSSCVDKSTIDESPFAYKDSKVIEAAIGDTVDIDYRIKTIYNFKATD
jgi:RNA-splicing ligase RtcB